MMLYIVLVFPCSYWSAHSFLSFLNVSYAINIHNLNSLHSKFLYIFLIYWGDGQGFPGCKVNEATVESDGEH